MPNPVPAIHLPPPLLQPRRLLDEIDRMPQVEGDYSQRWMQGVTWAPFICRNPTVDGLLVCAPETMDVVPALCVTWETQQPFRISDAFTASTLIYTEAEVDDRLTGIYNRTISAAFAAELLGGTGSGARSLSNVATAPADHPFGAAVSVQRALGAIETEIARRLQGGVGYIHVPPGLLAEAVYAYGVHLDNDDDWVTPAGNYVISDAGYTDPVGPTGQPDAADGTDWIYASGPVFFDSTVPDLLDVQTTIFTRNQFTTYIAGFGILVFDSCPVTAVLASYG